MVNHRTTIGVEAEDLMKKLAENRVLRIDTVISYIFSHLCANSITQSFRVFQVMLGRNKIVWLWKLIRSQADDAQI